MISCGDFLELFEGEVLSTEERFDNGSAVFGYEVPMGVLYFSDQAMRAKNSQQVRDARHASFAVDLGRLGARKQPDPKVAVPESVQQKLVAPHETQNKKGVKKRCHTKR